MNELDIPKVTIVEVQNYNDEIKNVVESLLQVSNFPFVIGGSNSFLIISNIEIDLPYKDIAAIHDCYNSGVETMFTLDSGLEIMLLQ